MKRCCPRIVPKPLTAVLLAFVVVAGCGKGSPEKYLKIGQDHLNKGKTKEALKAYSQAIDADSKCKKAYIGRAICYADLGQDKKAIADYTKAIELDPSGDAYPYDQRSILYRRAKQNDKAEADKAKAEVIRDGRWEELGNEKNRRR